MSISFGPKLGLLNNANIGEAYYDQLRQFLQAIDQLVQMSVLSASVANPPIAPSNGDAYLLLSTPTGVWTGFSGYVAVWDTQVTSTGTDTQVPAWVFYQPKPGWLVWSIDTASLSVYDGTNWNVITSVNTQAELPAGSVNGSNLNFVLSFVPTPSASLQLYLNGVFQVPGINYSISGVNISMNLAPNSPGVLYAVYDYL